MIVCVHVQMCRYTCVCAECMHAHVLLDNLPVLQMLPTLWVYLFICLFLVLFEIVCLTGLDLAE